MRSRARRSKHTFGLKNLVVKSWSNEGSSTHTAVSAHLSNTSAKRRRCKATFGPAQESRRENYADIIAGSSNTSAHRERGKSKMSSIEETLEKTLLIPPPDVVPMWGQMEDQLIVAASFSEQGTSRTGPLPGTEACKRKTSRQTKAVEQEAPKWRVALHGSLQLDKDKMQTKDTDHVQQKGVAAVRPPSSTEGNAEWGDAGKKKKRTGQTFEVR